MRAVIAEDLFLLRDGLTRMLWEECALVGMPRAVVITKLDHQRADFDEALRACRDAFGDAVAPLYVPVAGDQGELQGCQIMCPRHGALFDVTTGRALTLPAVMPLETYTVRIEGDDVFVEDV